VTLPVNPYHALAAWLRYRWRNRHHPKDTP
jgi:hypothetical protein